VNVRAPVPTAGGPAPAETVDPDVDRSTDLDTETPWVAIVWNDPINLMSYVSYVFQKLFGYSQAKADELMLDVHEKGRAVVTNGTREKVELDVFRLHEHGLWATMEQQ
jgi:ATP-dependent Clp protease adaptor protein ClpS